MTANEKRQAVVDKYRGILGRNLYSQPRRTYCFTKYANGKYYSDCSSSVVLSYTAAGYPIRDKSGYACPNTVGMYSSPDLAQVDVTIQKGVIQDVEKLRVGDLLLFAGSDKGRASAGYVGHVEMVYRINGKTVTLCGHGSGTPRTVASGIAKFYTPEDLIGKTVILVANLKPATLCGVESCGTLVNRSGSFSILRSTMATMMMPARITM